MKKLKKEKLKKEQLKERLLKNPLKALQKRAKKGHSCEILGHGIR